MSSALVTGFGPVAIVYAVVVCCTSQFCAARRSRELSVLRWNARIGSRTRPEYSSP